MRSLKPIYGLLLLLILSGFVLNIPDNTGNQTALIPFNGKFFTTDNLGNVFTVNQDNSIVKYDKLGKAKANVNFKIYGSISQLDVSNPFEIYAYYRDQQTVLILDNLLSLRGTIDLNDISTGEISAACRSFDNGLWYFDAGNTKIIKTDKALVQQQESRPLASWTSEKWNPIQMLDNDKNLFVNDSALGIAVFDVFANYYKTLDLTGLNDMQLKKNKLYFLQCDYFQTFDLKYLRFDTLYHAPKAHIVRQDADKFYVWQRDTIFTVGH